MSEPFIGEIRIFAGTFAPRNWALCDGQILAISQNDALFSLLGTIYGGDGRTTFALPDLRGRVPIHAGSGPGLSQRPLGQKSGAENTTLTVNQMPAHTHPSASTNSPTEGSPDGNILATQHAGDNIYAATGGVSMAPGTSSNVGGSQAHTNLMPCQCVNFIIALVGIYPSRN
jgi:microcystin-dependent protein